MKIKEIIIFFELVFICFLGGCSGVTGLDEQLIVYGIGVDKIDDMYELTLQTLNTQNTSESDSKEEKKSVVDIHAKAKTLIDAASQIENQTGKKILYSHAIVLIIGEESAKNGISDIITFFSTNHKLRPTVEVLISDCFAKDIFSNEEIEKTVYSEDIFAVTTNVGKKNNDAIHSNIRYLLSDINNELKAAKVWYIEYDKGRVSCQRIALFKSDKLIDVLDEETSKGILLIYGEAKNLSDSAKLNDCTISYKVSQAKSNVNVEIKNNKPVFSLNLALDLDLYGADNIDRSDEIKAMLENRLASLQANAINFCIKKYGCDIFNFHRYIMNSDSKFFKANLSQMENIIQSADYNATIDIKVKYMGSNQKISSLVY